MCSTAVESLFASTSSICDDVDVCILPVEQYEETNEKNFASTSSAYNNINICVSPVDQYLKTTKENISLLNQDPKKVLLDNINS